MTETFEDYKGRVRAEAIRVAKEMGWCDDGLNKSLKTLDLKPVQTFRVPVKATAGENTQTITMEVREAETIGWAIAMLRNDPERTLKYLGRFFYEPITEFEVLEPPTQPTAGEGVPLIGDPPLEDGEWYATSTESGGPNQCRVVSDYYPLVYCTRPLGHAHDWHVAAGKNAGVLAVFPAAEGDVRPDADRFAEKPAYESPDDADYEDEDED